MIIATAYEWMGMVMFDIQCVHGNKVNHAYHTLGKGAAEQTGEGLPGVMLDLALAIQRAAHHEEEEGEQETAECPFR